MYLIQEHYRNEANPTTLVGPETVPQDLIHNDSWTVDHFLRAGCQSYNRFLGKVFTTCVSVTKKALTEVGNYGWEDSCEIDAVLYWTKYLPAAFLSRRGFSIKKWLPILFHQDGRINLPGYFFWYITDEANSSNGHTADYRTTVCCRCNYY